MHVPPVFCFAEIGHAVREGFVICVTDRNINKPSHAPGSPCQGSWRRRRLRGSVNALLSLSLANARQLPRQREPRKRKSIGCLAEETKRPKINSSCAPGSPCQGSWRRRRLRGSRNVSFSPSASLTLGSSLIRGSREKRNKFLLKKRLLCITNFH